MPRISERPGIERPDEKAIGDLRREAVVRDAQREEMDAAIDAAIEDTKEVIVPDPNSAVAANLEKVHSRYAFTFLEIISGIFLRERPRIEVIPRSESQAEKERAERLALLANYGIWEVYRRRRQNVWNMMVKDVLRYARGVQKWHIDYSLWADEPKPAGDLEEWKKVHDEWLKWAPVPLVAQHVNPRGFHEWNDAYGTQQTLEVQSRTIRDVLASYWEAREIGALKERPLDSTVWWFEHQNRRWTTYGILEGGPNQGTQGLSPAVAPIGGAIILEQWEHPYGRPSYVTAVGNEQTALEPHRRTVSLLWPMLPELEQKDRTMSQVATHVKTTGWFYPYFIQSDESPGTELEGGRPKGFIMRPFVWEQFYKGEQPAVLSPPPLSSDVYRFLDLLQRDLELHGMVPINIGQVADYASGYSVGLRMHAVRSRYSAIADNLRAAFEDLCYLFFNLVQAVREDVGMLVPTEGGRRYIKIHAGDLDRRPLLETRYPLTLPTDRQVNLRLAREATAEPNPLMSVYEAQDELLELKDVQRTQKLILQEQLDRAVLPLLAQRVLERVQLAQQAGPNGAGGRTGPEGQPAGNAVAPGVGEPLVPTPPPPTRRPGGRRAGGRAAGQAAQPPIQPGTEPFP